MAKFKPSKSQTLDNILVLYVLITGIPLNLACNIIYDLWVKNFNIGYKLSIIIIAVMWVLGIFYVIHEVYIKPFDKLQNKKVSREK